MIAVIAIAVFTIAYRVRLRLFTKAELALLLIFAVNWLVIWLQSAICDHCYLPERRYWAQAGILLSGWTVWGICRLSSALAKKFSLAQYILPAVVAVLAAVEVVMIMKPHIPVSRRYAYLRVVDWAAEKIKADWAGPLKDVDIEYLDGEYRQPNRPIVRAHTARLPYILNGRNDSVARWYADDTPDYICDEEKNIDLASASLHGARYELMDRIEIGKRRFALYRRIGREPAP